ncbi:MAG: hypothetical protein WCG80_16150 [Spirochaetales bacterium]
MASKKTVFTSATLLSLALGLFLLLAGLQTLIDFNTDAAKAARALFRLFGADQTSDIVTMVIAVFKILAGTVLLVGPFGILTLMLRKIAFWAIVALWIAVVVWTFFLTGRLLKPTVMAWLQDLALDVAILAALWTLKPEK